MTRVLWYAAGGGLGHLARAMAILRHLRTELPEMAPLLVTTSPYAHLPIKAGIPTLRLPGVLEAKLFPVSTLPEADLLVVDTFPKGIHGELDPTRYPLRALIAREHGPKGGDAYHLRLAPHEDDVGIVLQREAHEVLTREQARLALGVGDEPLVLAMHAGDDGEIMTFFDQVMASIPAGFQGICLTPLPLPGGPWPQVRHVHPAMEVLPAADVVVCGAGYNSYWETRALGLRAVFRPFKRSHDRQVLRAEGFSALTGPDELRGIILKAASEPAPQAVPCGGARVAASRLATLVKRPPA